MYIHKRNNTRITDSQYNSLSYMDKEHYRKDYSSSDDIVNTVVNIGIGLAIGSIFDSDSSSSSSSSNDSSSFDGFGGGGEFGGGGADTDW